MCGCTGEDRRRRVSVKGVVASEATRLATVEPGAPYVLAAVVVANGAGTVEIRSRGVVVATQAITGIAPVSIRLSEAVLESYDLWITPTSGAITVKSAELATS